MNPRKSLSDLRLQGSQNLLRVQRRELAEAAAIDPERYGIPTVPDDLDENERAAWDHLAIEYHDRLYTVDGKALAELARVECLLAQAMKAAKRGQVFDGHPNHGHTNTERYIKLRDRMRLPFDARRPRPASAVTPLDALNNLLDKQERAN